MSRKNKFACVLLCLVLLPLALLFGCGDVNSFSVQAYHSSSAGTTSGSGTYTEGSTVTLTAIAKSGSFLGWVRDNAILSDGGTYTISNTTSQTDETYIAKSVLTFSASSATQGSYTAVFNDSKVMYVQLSSIEISQSEETEDDLAGLSISEMTISEGSNALTTIFSLTDAISSSTIKSAVAENASVMKLSTDSSQFFQAYMFILTSETTSTRVTLRAGLNFQSSTAIQTDESGKNLTDENGNYVYEEISTTSGTYHVEYSSGVYTIVFTFSLNDAEYQMTVTYLTLGVEVSE